SRPETARRPGGRADRCGGGRPLRREQGHPDEGVVQPRPAVRAAVAAARQGGARLRPWRPLTARKPRCPAAPAARGCIRCSPSCSHAHGDVEYRLRRAAAVAARVDSLEHGMALDPALLAQMAAQGTALTPTLTVITGSLEQVASRPAGPVKDWYVGGAWRARGSRTRRTGR